MPTAAKRIWAIIRTGKRCAKRSLRGEGYSVRRSSSLGEDMIYYCRLFSPEGEAAYLVRIAIPTSSEWQVFRDTLPTLAWFLLLDFLVCLLFTYIETEYIISPVRRLAKDAALNLRLSTRYPELQPIVDVLNKRNSEVSEQFRELSEEKDLVEKAQRSKNDFIANVTHEMNTPLTSIRGYSELIAGGALNEEQTKAAANTLVKQSDRLSKLIACIINYNEIDNSRALRYEVDLSKLAEEILEVLAPDIEKRNIALEKRIEPGISVMSRHERLNEVLGNLIRNAIRYNKEGGKPPRRHLPHGGTGIPASPCRIPASASPKKISRAFSTVSLRWTNRTAAKTAVSA